MFQVRSFTQARLWAVSALGIAAAVVGFQSLGHAQQVIPGEYIVKYKDSAAVSMLSVRANVSTSVADHHALGQIMKVRLDQSNEVRALLGLLRNPNVEYVVPNVRVRMQLVSSTPDQVFNVVNTQDQWANNVTGVEKAWAIANNKGSRRVKVAVIDTGMDSRHVSLSTNAIPGYDFAGNDNDPKDETSQQNPGHGTHCSGSVGGNGTSGGISGANQEVSLMPVRFLNANGGGDLNNAVKSIDFAIEKGVQVISNSWGAEVPASTARPIIEAIERASKAGIVVVSAAGNSSKNNDTANFFPTNAKYQNTISVAASDENDRLASFSNFGKAKVDLAAPGTNILSTLPNNRYGKLSGTSMATPLVSGMAAFLKAQDETLTGEQIRSILQLTGKQAQLEVACNCRVDLEAATQVVISKKMFVFPAAATIAVGATVQFGAKYAQGNVTFASSNPQVATIDANGMLTAVANGQTVVTATDASGAKASSLTIAVGGSNGGGGDEPPPPGGGEECPIQNPILCMGLCMLDPTLPWCPDSEGSRGGGSPFPWPVSQPQRTSER